jgi:hypothetical protein
MVINLDGSVNRTLLVRKGSTSVLSMEVINFDLSGKTLRLSVYKGSTSSVLIFTEDFEIEENVAMVDLTARVEKLHAKQYYYTIAVVEDKKTWLNGVFNVVNYSVDVPVEDLTVTINTTTISLNLTGGSSEQTSNFDSGIFEIDEVFNGNPFNDALTPDFAIHPNMQVAYSDTNDYYVPYTLAKFFSYLTTSGKTIIQCEWADYENEFGVINAGLYIDNGLSSKFKLKHLYEIYAEFDIRHNVNADKRAFFGIVEPVTPEINGIPLGLDDYQRVGIDIRGNNNTRTIQLRDSSEDPTVYLSENFPASVFDTVPFNVRIKKLVIFLVFG